MMTSELLHSGLWKLADEYFGTQSWVGGRSWLKNQSICPSALKVVAWISSWFQKQDHCSGHVWRSGFFSDSSYLETARVSPFSQLPLATNLTVEVQWKAQAAWVTKSWGPSLVQLRNGVLWKWLHNVEAATVGILCKLSAARKHCVGGLLGATMLILNMKSTGYSEVPCSCRHSIFGIFMQNWDEVEERGNCSGEQDLKDAEKACERLGIELHTVNFVKEYWTEVFSKFTQEVLLSILQILQSQFR